KTNSRLVFQKLGSQILTYSVECNKVVDCIAKADGGVIEQLVILEDPPHYVR
ncbi:hypothetical protein Gogos_009222, partial [Gossypium gossypioides]|nr:hypothetical protein [Gossypium gossypioides]